MGACALHKAGRNKALLPLPHRLWSTGECGEAEPQTDLEKRDRGAQLDSIHVAGWTTPEVIAHRLVVVPMLLLSCLLMGQGSHSMLRICYWCDFTCQVLLFYCVYMLHVHTRKRIEVSKCLLPSLSISLSDSGFFTEPRAH